MKCRPAPECACTDIFSTLRDRRRRLRNCLTSRFHPVSPWSTKNGFLSSVRMTAVERKGMKSCNGPAPTNIDPSIQVSAKEALEAEVTWEDWSEMVLVLRRVS